MTDYMVDRALLESHSTEEILRILKDERDDYTAEALWIFEEILAARGVDRGGTVARRESAQRSAAVTAAVTGAETMIRNPGDAVRILNDLLAGVLDGTVEPEVAQAAGSLVMGILRALEQEYMSGAEDR